MKILILGASGTVGSAIFKCASNKYQCWGTYNKNKPYNLDFTRMVQWDIEDTAALRQMLMDISPNVIISSLTGDFKMQLSAYNCIADYLQKNDAHMIFISTANVFDGATDRPHTELDQPHPLSTYGKFKLECENLLQTSEHCLIIRIPKIMTQEIVNNLIFGEPVYRNLYASLNTPLNVAEAIVHCIQIKKCGVLHLSSYDYISADIACTRMGKSGYAAENLTIDIYVDMLNCEITKLQTSEDGNFYFALQSVDNISKNFAISCEDIVDKMWV